MTITAIDYGSPNRVSSVTISVIVHDINEAPAIGSLGSQRYIYENAAAGSILSGNPLLFIDPDQDETASWQFDLSGSVSTTKIHVENPR